MGTVAAGVLVIATVTVVLATVERPSPIIDVVDVIMEPRRQRNLEAKPMPVGLIRLMAAVSDPFLRLWGWPTLIVQGLAPAAD